VGTRHTLQQASGGGAQRIAFKILDTAGTPSIVHVMPPLGFAGDVTITDDGTGKYTVSIAQFKGPQGVAIPIAVPLSTAAAALFAVVGTPSYSGETLSFAIAVLSSSTLVDSSVFVAVDAF
jgi:hypothetical protein